MSTTTVTGFTITTGDVVVLLANPSRRYINVQNYAVDNDFPNQVDVYLWTGSANASAPVAGKGIQIAPGTSYRRDGSVGQVPTGAIHLITKAGTAVVSVEEDSA